LHSLIYCIFGLSLIKWDLHRSINHYIQFCTARLLDFCSDWLKGNHFLFCHLQLRMPVINHHW